MSFKMKDTENKTKRKVKNRGKNGRILTDKSEEITDNQELEELEQNKESVEEPHVTEKQDEPEDSNSPENDQRKKFSRKSKRSENFGSSTTLSSAPITPYEEPSDDQFSVVVRVRPLNSNEVSRTDNFSLEFPGDGQVTIETNGATRNFQFTGVFEPNASQEELFENCGITRLVDMALNGYACTALAFGQTGSGKTHTMTGPPHQSVTSPSLEREFIDGNLTDQSMIGLIQRSFKYLYQQVKNSPENTVIRASYLEIYNEQVIDLLNPSHKRYLSVRWSKNKGFYVENLFSIECAAMEDLKAVLEEGEKVTVNNSDMPLNKSRNVTQAKSVRWDSNVDLRSPDSKKKGKNPLSFYDNDDDDEDPSGGISVVGFKKQIKTSNSKNTDRRTLAKKNKPVKKNVPEQWKAKPKGSSPPEEEPVLFKKVTRISPATILVPSAPEIESDSDFSFTEDLDNLLSGSPRNKHVNKRILRDLEVLNSVNLSKNPQDLTSSQSVGDLSFRKPAQNTKSSLSFNDLRLGLHSQRSLKSSRSENLPTYLQKHSKRPDNRDYPDSVELELDDPFDWKSKTYARDRHTFVKSDFPDKDVKKHFDWNPTKHGFDDDVSSQSLGSFPSPTDLLFDRDSFLFSPTQRPPPKYYKVQHTPQDTPRTKAYKLTTRNTVVSRADEKITSDRPHPRVKKRPATSPEADGGLIVGQSPTDTKEPSKEELQPKKPSDVSKTNPPQEIPQIERYGSGDLKLSNRNFDSPTEENLNHQTKVNKVPETSTVKLDKSPIQDHKETQPTETHDVLNPASKSPEASQKNPKVVVESPSTATPSTSKGTKSASPKPEVSPTPNKESTPSPRAKVKSQKPGKASKENTPRGFQPQVAQSDESPWGTPRVAATTPNVSSAPPQNQPQNFPGAPQNPYPGTDPSQPQYYPGIPRPVQTAPSLKRLAFNKLKEDFDEQDSTPRVIPTAYTAQKPPVFYHHVYPSQQDGQPGHLNPEFGRATVTSPYPQTAEGEQQFHGQPHPNQQQLPSLSSNFPQPQFFVHGQPISFPGIAGFPYPDLVYQVDPENPDQDTGQVTDDHPQTFQKVIFLGNPDPEQGSDPLGVPFNVFNQLRKTSGVIITELESGEEGPQSSKGKESKSGSSKSSGSSSSSSGSSSSTSSSSSSSGSSSDTDVPTEDPTIKLLKREGGQTSRSEGSPTQFLKNIKQIGKKKKQKGSSSSSKTTSDNSEMNQQESLSDRRRKSGMVDPLPSYYNPNGTQYIMRSKSNSRETSANTNKSSDGSGNNKHENVRPKLETIESARDPHNFDPGDDIPDFDDSDIEGVYEGGDMYLFYIKTDDGEIIGPLKFDVEDIEMGLPTSDNPSQAEGMRNRTNGSHGLNENSSRSHSMLTVTIDSETQDQEDENLYITKRGKLTFVDLAGSEKVRDTNSTGGTLTEANSINKSLLILGNCISHLGDSKRRQGHIPYRDSKLTKLLADSLGGNGVTLMIACVTPSSHNAGETLNTLRYASRAKKIKTKPVIKMDPREKLILSLKREVKVLRNENHYLRQQLEFPAKPKGQLQKENDEKFMTFMKEQERKESGLYEMLQEYMVENEALRTENSDHHSTKDKIRREQQGLYRENENLMKRVEELERIVTTSPQTWQQISRNTSQVEPPDFTDKGSSRQPFPSGQQYPIPGQGQGNPVGGRGMPARLPHQDLPRPDPNQIGYPPNNRTRPPPPPGGTGHPQRPPHRLSDSINRHSQGQLDIPLNGGLQDQPPIPHGGHPPLPHSGQPPIPHGGHPPIPHGGNPPLPQGSQIPKPHGSPNVKHRQGSPNRTIGDRKASQGSNSDAIHGMNAKLKSELQELEAEIAHHQRYTGPPHQNTNPYNNPYNQYR